MNILKLAKECEIIFDTSEQIEAFAQAVIEDYKASLVPVAHIDITKRKVILDDTFVFKTPTIAVMDDIQLYALGETK